MDGSETGAAPTGSAFTADWLAAREAADAAARHAGLAARFLSAVAATAGGKPPLLLDLAAGDGNGVRWLAPRLPAAHRWLLIDRDAARLGDAVGRLTAWAAGQPGWRSVGVPGAAPALLLHRPDGDPITIDLLPADLATGLATGLATIPWAQAAAVTASALLDLVSAAWLAGLADRLARHRVPALFTLTVNGQDRWRPDHPDDAAIQRRFAADQHRDKGFGPALGTEAPAVAADRLRAAGLAVATGASAWSLGPETDAVLAGVVAFHAAAAHADDPAVASRWTAARAADRQARRLRVTIGHTDLLAVPAAG